MIHDTIDTIEHELKTTNDPHRIPSADQFD
jgi:hypothetical protein